jgi:hypothetical protein
VSLSQAAVVLLFNVFFRVLEQVLTRTRNIKISTKNTSGSFVSKEKNKSDIPHTVGEECFEGFDFSEAVMKHSHDTANSLIAIVMVLGKNE